MPTLSTTPLTAQESAAVNGNRDVNSSAVLTAQVARLQEPGGPPTRATILSRVQERKAAADAAVQEFFASILVAHGVSVPGGATVSRASIGGVDSLVVSN